MPNKNRRYDYKNDRYGKICLELAAQCKTEVGFGAVLVKNGRILGRGRNRLATDRERKLIKGLDYGSHAEESCVIDALKTLNAFKNDIEHMRNVLVGSQIFVLGLALRGRNKGRLTTRRGRVFICKKCPRTVLVPFQIPVNIPHVNGWTRLEPDEAVHTARRLCGKGYWKKFVGGAR